jgi:chromosome segregation protein
MYLRRLEIHGFKSFAQKTVLEFGKGIVAIVGPNGSGKSNVADAIRWVLGEQSAKLMRGKKSEDVIFAGSDKRIRLGFAEVTATFDNGDRRIPIDVAEVSIGRRIDRSGESQYLINGNVVRLLDVIDLVLKSNIGTSRYTVIGQGTIDQMILAGPAEVKNLLDEASGVKNYYLKRERTLRRLEQTANNLIRAEDLIREIEPRLKSLRRQAKRMQAREEIETELKLYQREFYSKAYFVLQKILDGFHQKTAEFEKKKNALLAEVSQERKIVESLEDQSQHQSHKFKDIQALLGRLQSQKNKLLEDLSLVWGKMSSLKTATAGDTQTLLVETHAKQRRISEVQDKIRTMTEGIVQAEKKFVEQFKLQEEVSKKLNQLYQNLSNPISVDWRAIDRELLALENSLNKYLAKLQQLDNVQEARRGAAQVKESFDKFKDIARRIIISPQANATKVKQELDEVARQKEDLAAKVNAAQLDLSRLKIALDFSEKELATLQQEKLHLDLELKKSQTGSLDEFWQELLKEEQRISGEVEKLAREIAALELGLKVHYDEDEARQKQLRIAEGQFRNKQDELSRLKDRQAVVNVEQAKYDTQMQALAEEAVKVLGQEIWQAVKDKELPGVTADLENKIARLKNQLEMIGGMDELTLKEYQETEARYNNLSNQVSDLKQGMQDLRNIMDELDEHIKTRFNESFHKINEKFENYFRVLFNGGRAYLSMIKEEAVIEQPQDVTDVGNGRDHYLHEDEDRGQQLRPEEKLVKKYEKGVSNIIGIDIKATPPGKKLSQIQALSGGERSLTSIALLCSLLSCFPSPFAVLDEVDAALDDANTIRFGQILGTLAEATQFVTITHNRETMARANALYGVTMGDDGISKLLSVKLEQAKAYAK